MGKSIDINSDMGESFGRYTLGTDAELMPFITSANIACGWHGGDSMVMNTSVSLAIEHDVAIGAHVSYPDLLGFGMREMTVAPQELYSYVLYQAGALAAFANSQGSRLEHVKPHGSLYVACVADKELAEALVAAIKDLGDGIALMLMGDLGRSVAGRAGVPYAAEGFIDTGYDSEGNLVFASTTAERLLEDPDPEVTAERAQQICTAGVVSTVDGGTIELDVETLCIHGDLPRAVETARRVRERLDEVGVEVKRLRG